MTMQILLGGGIRAEAVPTTLSGSVTQHEPAPNMTNVTTDSSVVVLVNGVNAGNTYSYSWEHVSGSIIAADSPGSTTTFTATVSKNTTALGTYRCRVTVAPGVDIYTPPISISLTYTSTA